MEFINTKEDKQGSKNSRGKNIYEKDCWFC